MEIAVRADSAELTLGPVLFKWKPDVLRDFYLRIADEAPVTTVYVGEVVCSKRAPFFEPHYGEVARRLKTAGKRIVFSTLSEVILKHDRRMVESLCAVEDTVIEANDASALWHLSGRAHHIGPFMNVYNEDSLARLAAKGATNICLPVELPATSIAAMGAAAKTLGVTIEVQVFGRMSLALSARCYHARAHGRTRDSCRFACEDDPDGLELTTLAGQPFLAINGIQTMSHDYLNLIHELPKLREMGISRFRLSPHSCDMVVIAKIFRSVLDGCVGVAEASARLDATGLNASFSNGFFYRKPGFVRNQPDAG
jgi:collagenase-like PrtC family protease